MKNKFLWAFIISELLIIIPMLVLTIGKSVNLKCRRIEPSYVNCQQQFSHFYGLWSSSPTSFRLMGMELEKYGFKEDFGAGTYLYLQTHHQQEELYFYGDNLQAALADKQRLAQLLGNTGSSSLELTLQDSSMTVLGFLEIFLGVHIIIYCLVGFSLFFLTLTTVGYFLITKK
ncbi:hypothetical protein [Anabaena sp. CA = ATCC 33047]|uniref:hypothetical protein n=1 Tax=Anabaena sp. (strain CA / ATCC 33047) TaxID=52271 RepID=UPI00082BAFB3|nr:hypothetical protein [Anabaena sp. CA = ATCC 33047]